MVAVRPSEAVVTDSYWSSNQDDPKEPDAASLRQAVLVSTDAYAVLR